MKIATNKVKIRHRFQEKCEVKRVLGVMRELVSCQENKFSTFLRIDFPVKVKKNPSCDQKLEIVFPKKYYQSNTTKTCTLMKNDHSP